MVLKAIGSVSELWRCPVKSMLGESCETLSFDARGVKGNRQFAIQNTQDKLVGRADLGCDLVDRPPQGEVSVREACFARSRTRPIYDWTRSK